MRWVVFALAFIAMSALAISQNIPVYDLRYTHPCNLQHAPPLQESPPYSWDMPLAVFQTYFAIDSLCGSIPESYNYDEVVDILLDSLTVEAYEWLLPYINTTINYDPLAFSSYTQLAPYFDQSYRFRPESLLFIYEVAGKEGISDKANTMVALSSGIYRVRITEAHTDTVDMYHDFRGLSVISCVDTEVLSAYKGEKLPGSVLDPETGQLIRTLKLSYDHKWSTIFNDDDVQIMGIISGDTARYTPEQYGSHPVPQVGDEYVLFVKLYMEPHLDSIGMPYHVFPQYGFSRNGGLFRIQNNCVNDIENLFQLGATVSLDDFIYELIERLDQLTVHQ